MGLVLFRKSYGAAASSATSNDITWTFDQNYQVGDFYGSQKWVLDPGGGVTVTGKTPEQTGSGSSLRHGDMINPTLRDDHSYDGRAAGYNATYLQEYPITLAAGDSLVSAYSRPTGDGLRANLLGVNVDLRTYLISVEVLTCVDQTYPDTAFRPPFSGSSKPVFYTTDVRTGLLPSLTMQSGSDFRLPSGATKPQSVARYFERPHIHHCTAGDGGDNVHPLDNQPDYYRDTFANISQAALIICCDYADRTDALYPMVQHGIDQHYCWQTDTTPTKRVDRCSTRFTPLLAGLMLGQSAMLSSDCTSGVWGVSWVMHDNCTYTAPSDLWFADGHSVAALKRAGYRMHTSTDAADPSDQEYEHINPQTGSWCGLPPGNMYRHWYGYQCNYRGWTWVGMALAAVKLGLKTHWGHDPFFNYCRRWMLEDVNSTSPTWDTLDGITAANPCGDGYSGTAPYRPGGTPTASYWVKNMWDTYYNASEW